MLFAPYARFHILVKIGLLSDRLLGNSCSLDLRYVFFLVQVPKGHFSFFFQPLVYGVGIFF